MNVTTSLRNRSLAPTAMALGCFLAHCAGQGIMQFTFEGQSPGTFSTISEYSESGMRFYPYGPEGVALVGSGVSWAPDNGTGHLESSGGNGLVFSFSPLGLFSLFSFDLAEGATLFPGPVTVHVLGYKPPGAGGSSPVTIDLTTDGINDGPGGLQDFETFYFDSRFVDLYRVDILTDRWSLDNVVVGIPEPSTFTLVGLGGFFLAAHLLRTWRSKR